ncbi:MAG: glycerophosphodiester phosphodiesterase [Planctomycetota bacterium]|nr:MAG: glycerophosphodiester phosphodiesterase [Planctomycetota bacterium]
MISAVVESLKSSWKGLVLCDVLFKLIAFVVLTPLVSLVFRLLLAISGRTVLADADIARFLLHPIGWITIIVVGAATIGILALEQSSLMSISLAAAYGRSLRVLASLRFVAAKTPGILQIVGRMVARVLLLAAPFLAIGGGTYWALLTDHDINFYLTEKPPRFFVAAGIIAAVLAVLVLLVVQCVVSWAVAIQLYLFENVPPAVCLGESRRRLVGKRATIARWVVTWFVVNALLALAATAVIVAVGQTVVPAATGSVWTLAVVLGLVLAAWAAVNLATNLLAAISFAVMQGHVYDRFGRGPSFALPDDTTWGVRGVAATRGRLVAALAVGVVASALVGATAMHTVQLEDDVLITAHRGASGRAPENTLASVRAAIEDESDYVEIDVQESKDGQVLVAHDSDLMKVAGQPLRIWEATADELRAVDIGSYFGDEFGEERMPTLAEVLQAAKGKIKVNIELKYYGHDQDLERKVVELVEEHGMADDVVIMSLEAPGIAKIKELRPDWTVGLLTAVAVGDTSRAEADFLAVSTRIATRAFIRSSHRQDKDVFVWTVNDPLTMSQMISRGADNLITDEPALARRVLAERAEMSPVERLLLELAIVFGAEPPNNVEQ